jgi:anti-sigma regulatory factor (Ser/Thr protein kinase)
MTTSWRPPAEARPPDVETFQFDRSTLHEVRSLVGREALRHRLPAARHSDLVTATSELAANSVLHGGGCGVLAVWVDDGALLIEVEDTGWIKDPLAGRRRPDPTQVSGRGLWLANALCDLVQIRSGPTGTVVRLRMKTGWPTNG